MWVTASSYHVVVETLRVEGLSVAGIYIRVGRSAATSRVGASAGGGRGVVRVRWNAVCAGGGAAMGGVVAESCYGSLSGGAKSMVTRSVATRNGTCAGSHMALRLGMCLDPCDNLRSVRGADTGDLTAIAE